MKLAIDQLHNHVIFDILNKFDYTALCFTIDGEVIFANKAFYDLYDLCETQLAEHHIYDAVFGITTKERWDYLLSRTRESGGKWVYERKWSIHDTVRYSKATIILYNVMGEERLLFFSQDITEMTLSRMRMQDLNKMLNRIIDNLPVYLFVKDVNDDLRYLIWNKAFAEYSKIPAEKVIGHTDFEVFPDFKDAQQFRDDDLRVIETGEMARKNETYMASDGSTRTVQTYKMLLERNDGGPLLVGISLEMTDIEGIEKELIRARIKAEESDRLKSRFLANMSHEIRTPLNAIVGFAGLLSDADDDKMRDEFLQIINSNSEQLLRLIDDILDLSRIEAGTLEYNRLPMDLYAAMQNIYKEYSNRMSDGVVLVFDNANAPCKFIINEDRNRLKQVIDNLLNNAIKFTEQGEIHYGFYVEDDCIEVYVSDTGRGIPVEKQDSIFGRFVKLDDFTPGTGLGLPICKLIVETLGGKISVDSKEGVGSTFKFTIPYHNKAKNIDSKQTESPRTRFKPSSTNRTILFAEDVASNFLVVKRMIGEQFELLWAHDGEEAVNIAKEKKPDLILMDIKMPLKNGFEATREIREFDSEVPIIALSAHVFDEDRLQAQLAGMNDFLPKPVSRDTLEAVIASYL